MNSFAQYQSNPDYNYTRKWCHCDDCECNSDAEDVFVYSPWLQALADKPSGVLCTAQWLAPPSNAGDGNELSQKPGTIGPLGMCWRPIAYDPNAFAQLVPTSDLDGGVSGNAASVKAHLAGDAHTGALLVADFGVQNLPSQANANAANPLSPPSDNEQHLLDLSNCDCVCVRATVVPSNTDFRVVLVSGNSATCEVVTCAAKNIPNSVCNQCNQDDCYCIQLNSCRPVNTFQDGAINETIWDTTSGDAIIKVTFDASQIRYLGIQKDWNNQQDFTAEVTDIQFIPKGEQTCPRRR